MNERRGTDGINSLKMMKTTVIWMNANEEEVSLDQDNWAI
jgi:hypothetical protein